MASSESGSSDLTPTPTSTIGPKGRSSPTFDPEPYIPVSNISVTIPLPQPTFLMDASPSYSPMDMDLKLPISNSSSSSEYSKDYSKESTTEYSPESTPECSSKITSNILLHINELPEWAHDNPHIHSGYRPISNSASRCFRSCFHTHNETINIWSHFFPCILCVILEGLLTAYLQITYPDILLLDHMIFAIFLFCALLCFGASAIFHTLIAHSHDMRNRWLKLDFVGIIFLIVGCFISAVYMTFLCEKTLQYAYCGMISAMSVITLLFLLLPAFEGEQWRPFRVAAFCAMGASVLIPFIHAIAQFGGSKAMKQSGMPWYFAEAGALLVGVFCYAKRWPESWLPGQFDFCGHSHNIFHIMVVVAMSLHLVGLLQAFDYNYGNGECGWIP